MQSARFSVQPKDEAMTSDGMLSVAVGGEVGRLQFKGKDVYISRKSFTVIAATSTRVDVEYFGVGPCFVRRGGSGRSSPMQNKGEASKKSLYNGDTIVLTGQSKIVELTPLLEDEQELENTLVVDWGNETQIVPVDSRSPTPPVAVKRKRLAQQDDESLPSDKLLAQQKDAESPHSPSDELPAPKRKKCALLGSDDDEAPKVEAPKPAPKPRKPRVRKPKADGAAPKQKVVADGAAPKTPRVRKPKADGAAPPKPRVRKPKVVADGAAPPQTHVPITLLNLLPKNMHMCQDEVHIRAKNEKRYLQRRKQTSDNVQIDELRSDDEGDKMTAEDREFITTHPDDLLVDDKAIGALVGMQSKNYVALGCKKASIEKNEKLFKSVGVDVAAFQTGRNEHLGRNLFGKLLKLTTKASTREAAQQAIALSTQNNMLDQRFPFTSDFLASGPRGPVDVVRVHQSHKAQEDARQAALAKIEADRIARKLPVGEPTEKVASAEAKKKWHRFKKEDTDLYAKFDF